MKKGIVIKPVNNGWLIGLTSTPGWNGDETVEMDDTYVIENKKDIPKMVSKLLPLIEVIPDA